MSGRAVGATIAAVLFLGGCAASPHKQPGVGPTQPDTGQKLSSWLEYKKLEDTPENRRLHCEEVALLETLERAAQESRVDQSAAVRIAIMDLETRPRLRAFRRHLRQSIEVDQNEVESGAAAQMSSLAKPKRLYLRNLFKRFPKDGDSQMKLRIRQRMDRLHRELVDGADFASMAERESESQTRFRGGRMGVVKPGDLQPRIEEIAMNLRPDEISSVLETTDGLTILKCDDVFEAVAAPPIEVVRERYRKQLEGERFDSIWQRWTQSLRDEIVFDIPAIQNPAAPSVQIVATSKKLGISTKAEALAVLGLRRVTREPAEVPRSRIDDILFGWFTQLQAARDADALKLPRPRQEQLSTRWEGARIRASHEVARLVQERIRPATKEQLRTYFQANRASFRQPARYRLATISRTAPRGRLREETRLMTRVLEELNAGTLTFDDAARQFSTHASATNGGEIGWVAARQLAAAGPIVAKVVPTLEIGETSDLLQQRESRAGQNSLRIVRLEGREAARNLTFAEAEASVEKRLMQIRARQLAAEIETATLEGLRRQSVCEDRESRD